MKDEFLEILKIIKKGNEIPIHKFRRAICIGRNIYGYYYKDLLSFEEISYEMKISVDIIKEYIEDFMKQKNSWEKVFDKSLTFVYFLRADNGLIKIGFTSDVERRIETLRSMSPCKLKLLAKIKGDKKLEYDFQKKFSKYKHHGEWFEPDKSLMNLIETIKNNEQ